MKLTYLIVTLVTLIGCTNNANLYDPAAAGYIPPEPTTTIAPANTCEYAVAPKPYCQHADGNGYGTDNYVAAPGACDFTACGDSDYAESDQKRVYDAYNAQYGGKVILDNDALCLTKKNAYNGECNDANAYNVGKAEKCYYKGCNQPGKLGYAHYQILVQLYGVENVEVDTDPLACGDLVKAGCTNPSAENYDATAVVEDCSCRFKSCTDDRYIEYDQYNTVVNGYVNGNPQCASNTIEVVTCGSNCQTLNVGCTTVGADNYNPAAKVENGSCTFTGCLDEYWNEYTPELNPLVIDYAAAHGLTVDDILTKTCKTHTP